MSATAAIELTSLTKRFGDLTAVDSITLRVEPGTCFGFIGPNGAGKSTTIRMMLDSIRPTSGTATVQGLDCHHDMVRVHRGLGYLPAELRLPDDLDTLGYLNVLGQLRGLASTKIRDELIDRFDLDPTRQLRDLSTGNKRKVAVVQAFMHQPGIVLLDEPTSGIDPLMQHEFHEFLLDFLAQGGTAFLSSHALSEVERVADSVGIIRAGRLVRTAALQTLKADAPRTISIDFDARHRYNDLSRRLATIGGIDEIDMRPGGIDVVHHCAPDPILRAVLDVGTITAVRALDADLEDVFLQYYQALPT